MIYEKICNWNNANGPCINPSKSKCLLLSRTKRTFDVPDNIIRGNKIDFVESASNLGIAARFDDFELQNTIVTI